MSNVRFLLQHSVLIYLELNIKIKMKGRLICSSVYLCRYDEKQSNSRFHIYYVHTVEPTSAVASYNMFKSTTLIRLQKIYPLSDLAVHGFGRYGTSYKSVNLSNYFLTRRLSNSQKMYTSIL